ncbi:hypothetical protein GGU10DRAFT_170691 [Lentinula aff. detonsa]|uniref:RING-type E3 ubiquitin transferase n=1 Tax=Lentinula aff. detonsa TaxID=2804958 RepID=A0AA38NST5_9AGAR|nr:hypothetical protein GGU10DRAFT_170691 [Lentinula aff. detonsa]
MTSARKPCLYFAKNACSKGDQCQFSHDASLSSSSKTICPYFLKGDCRYGHQCVNLHATVGQELQPLLCKFFIKGECKNGSDCVFRHDKGKYASQLLRSTGTVPEIADRVSNASSQLSSLSLNMLPITPSSSPKVEPGSLGNSLVPISGPVDSPDESQAISNDLINEQDDVRCGTTNEEITSNDDHFNGSPSIEKWETASSTQLTDFVESVEVSGDHSSQPSSTYEQPVHNVTYSVQSLPPNAHPFVIHAPPYYDPNVYAGIRPMVPSYTPTFVPDVSGFGASSASNTSSAVPTRNHREASSQWCQQHFAYGHCPLGNSCRFRHFLTDEELQQLVQVQDRPRVERVQGGPRFIYASSEQSANSIRNKECKFWITNSCRRGDNCPYLHTTVGDSGSSPVTVNHVPPSNSEADDHGWGSVTNTVTLQDEDEAAEESRWSLNAPSAESWGDGPGWDDVSLAPWGNSQPSASPSVSKSHESSKKAVEGQSIIDDSWKNHSGPEAAHSKPSIRSRDGLNPKHRRKDGDTPPLLDRKGRWDNERTWSTRKANGSKPESSTPGLSYADELTSETSVKSLDENEASPIPPDCNDEPSTGRSETTSSSSEEQDVALGAHPEISDERTEDRVYDECSSNVVEGDIETSVDDQVTDPIVNDPVDNWGEQLENGSMPAFEEKTTSSVEGQKDGDEAEHTQAIIDVKPIQEENENVMENEVEDTQPSLDWETTDESWNASNWGPSKFEDHYQLESQKRLPCKAFGQGYCSFGENCRYVHIPQDGKDDEDSDATVTSDTIEVPVHEEFDEDVTSLSTRITRQPFFCHVTYGQNASPEQVITAFESNAIFVFDIPLTFGEEEFSSLVSRFGTVREMQVEFPRTGDTCYQAKITFSDRREAEEAVRYLHGSSDLGPNIVLRAYLDSKAPIINNWHPAESSPSVRISYATPSRTAWVYFESMDSFKKAEGLNGEVFNGRKIKITRPPRLKKHTHFPLRVEGLPISTQKQEVLALFRNAVHVEMTSPTYTDNPAEQLKNLLRSFGELEDLALDSSPSTVKARAIVFARFTEAAAAERAIATLNNTGHAFIGDARLSVQATFYSCYDIPQEKFAVIRADIDSLQEIHGPGVKVQQCIDPAAKAELRLYGSELIPFTKARRDLDLLIKGEIVLDDEARPLWDKYFDLPSCTKQINQLNSQKAESFFIERDFRNRHVLVFGSKRGRTRAKNLLGKLLAKVQSCVLTMSVSDACMGYMIRAGYANNTSTSDKLHFDFASRIITIRGSIDEREKEWATISIYTAECEAASTTVRDEQSCRLCLSTASEPITLGCEHKYCKRCLDLWFKSQIGPSFTRMTCIAATNDLDNVDGDEGEISLCSATIPYGLIRKILSDDEENDLLEHSFLSYIWARPEEYRLCPTNNCAMTYQVGSPGSLIHCPACKNWICSSCHVELHEGLTCSQYMDLTFALER